MPLDKLDEEIDRIVHGDHDDPFSILGMHIEKQAGGAERWWCALFSRRLARWRGRQRHRFRRRRVAAGPRARLLRRSDAGRKEAFRYRLRLLPHGSEDTYDMEDAYRFGPVLGELDIHLLVEGTHLRAVREARLAGDDDRRRRRHGLRGVGTERPAGQRRRRLQRLGRSPPPDALPLRVRRLGNIHSGRRRRRDLQVRDQGPLRQPAGGKGRPVRVRSGDPAEDRLDRPRSRPSTSGDDAEWMRSRRAPQRPRRAGHDLRGPPRLVEAQAGGRQPLPHLSRACRRSGALRQGPGLHPHRVDADPRVSVRRLMGLSAGRPVRAHQPLRQAQRLQVLRRSLPSAPGSAC